MDLIKKLSNLSKKDADLAGGKGASLGEMTRAGIPVPLGFVVTSIAFDNFLDSGALTAAIEELLAPVNRHDIHSVEVASEKITNLILNSDFPEDIAKEVLKYFKELDTEFVAVRSSATAEDSSNASWAGELESYLNTTEKTLLDNIQKCWASLFTPRAIFYRIEKGLHREKVSVAVVVQKMIQSEVSGITFTVHPVTEDKNQMVIEAGYGLGEAIVGGVITPDNYVINKNKLSIEDKYISEQEKKIVRGPDGTKEEEVAETSREKQKLGDKQILELAKICLDIENHYHFPCDIEWVYENSKFYIVQSRPITTLAN
jgi:pyruvate, water dikinase